MIAARFFEIRLPPDSLLNKLTWEVIILVSTCSAKRSLTELSQQIVFYIQNPSLLTPDVINQLLSQIETIRGQVREFPVALIKKLPILNELDLAAFFLQQAPTSTSPVTDLLATLQILDVTRSKIEDLNCC